MTKANVLVIAGYGLNCEEETLQAFKHNGANGKIIHINDLIENSDKLDQFNILAIPGGFSYGDDTGSGNALAQKIKLSLWDHLIKFLKRDVLVIGICNGCQTLANLGLVPGFEGNYGDRPLAVTYNTPARYQCRWVNVRVNADNSSPWLSGIEQMHIPVAHGEGRFFMDEATHTSLKQKNMIAARYVHADGSPASGDFPVNPNGSLDDIAAITDESGKILAIMPHPERGMFIWQRDDYAELKDQAARDGIDLSEESDGMAIFKNAVAYFSK